jgi:integrase
MGKKDRIFWRPDRKRFYADVRDLGHGKVSLKTADRDEAARELTKLLDEIAQARPIAADPLLSSYAEHHLAVKKLTRRPGTVERDRLSIDTFIAKMGDVRLSKIDVPMLTDYVAIRLRVRPTVSAQTVLHELHALSSLFRRAIAEGKAKTNPVRDLPDRPRIERPEATYLEIGEGAALLMACAEPLRPLVATFLLTGGRKSEVFGLMPSDVDFGHSVVHFHPNNYRNLKRRNHARTVPLWPQLAELLGHPIDSQQGLLFPGKNGKMLVDVRGGLNAAVEKAGIEKHVTLHTLRHTYAAARIQTLDQGHPVSIYTVMRELGHQSLALIERTYGHLMAAPHRSEVVEYR